MTGPPTAAASNLEELSRYASEFHRRRTDLIAAGKGSIAVLDGGTLVLHVVPHSALTEQTVISFEAITRERMKLLQDFNRHSFAGRLAPRRPGPALIPVRSSDLWHNPTRLQ